jgi:hypothetical protein
MPFGLFIAAVSLFAVLGTGPTQAAAMRCSNEEKTCIAACNKNAPKAALPACITTCGHRKAVCMRSGCWDNGMQRYCGLLRQ